MMITTEINNNNALRSLLYKPTGFILLFVLLNFGAKAQGESFKKDSTEISAGLEAFAQKNYVEAFDLLTEPAEKGNPVAQFLMGQLFAGTRPVKVGDKAFEWFSKSAEKSYPPAQFSMSSIYYSLKDYLLAFTWVKKAAELGYPDAYNNLASYYMRGVGVEENYTEALFWLKKLAAANPKSTFEADATILNIYGYLKQPDQAAAWVDQQNRSNLTYMLAVTYREGEQGYPKSDGIALKYFIKASVMGNKMANGKIEELYEANRGMPANEGGLGSLGVMYLEGKSGLKQNDSIAYTLLEKAAIKEDPKGTYFYGRCYENGIIVKKNIKLAMMYYKKALQLGYKPAEKDLRRLGQ